jgi:ribosomal protein S18 acetylase RimI-like enzyme
MTAADDSLPPGVEPPCIRIRVADLGRSADADALIRVLDAYARDPMGEGRPLTAETRACLIPALRQVPNALVLLASARHATAARSDAAVVVGAAVCFIGFSTFRARGLLNVHDLAVLPQWRGRGVGTRLLRTIETVARRRGYCKVNLEVRTDNRARQLYERLGYGAGAVAKDGQEAEAHYLFLEKRLDH